MILLAASSCLPQAPVPLHCQPLFLTPYTWSRAADHVLFLWRKWQTRASFSNSLRMSEHGKCSLNVAIITELLETVSKRSRMLRAGWDSIPHNCWHTCRCQRHKTKDYNFSVEQFVLVPGFKFSYEHQLQFRYSYCSPCYSAVDRTYR
jgi:hypothetical protein